MLLKHSQSGQPHAPAAHPHAVRWQPPGVGAASEPLAQLAATRGGGTARRT